MKTIQIDASTIHDYPTAAKALAHWLGADENLSLSQLQRAIQSRHEYMAVEVYNWPQDSLNWKDAAFTLEAIQQHSSTFFLIWGTKADTVNVHAASPEELLV